MVHHPGPRSALPRRLIKLVVALVAVGGVGFLLTRSMRGARANPYSIDPAALENWTVAVVAPAGPKDPVLLLQPPADLPGRLFDQVFHRVMESMRAPAVAGIALLLREELDRGFGGRPSADQLLAVARAAGLGGPVTVAPRCMAYRRVSAARVVQQVYFVVFDLPAMSRFREQLAKDLAAAPGWDPAALSPVMLVALAESSADRWLPLRADPAKDCQAPIVAAPR